MLKKEVCCLLW